MNDAFTLLIVQSSIWRTLTTTLSVSHNCKLRGLSISWWKSLACSYMHSFAKTFNLISLCNSCWNGWMHWHQPSCVAWKRKAYLHIWTSLACFKQTENTRNLKWKKRNFFITQIKSVVQQTNNTIKKRGVLMEIHYSNNCS